MAGNGSFKAALLAQLCKRPSETVDIEGMPVKVRGLSAGQRDRFIADVTDKDGRVRTDGFQTALVSLTVVGDDDQPVFSKEDVAALEEASSTSIAKIAETAMRLSGMSDKAVEEAEKNYDEIREEEPSSDYRFISDPPSRSSKSGSRRQNS